MSNSTEIKSMDSSRMEKLNLINTEQQYKNGYSQGTRKKIRKIIGINNEKSLIQLAEDSDVDLGKRQSTREKRAYDYFAEIVNERILEARQEVKEKKEKENLMINEVKKFIKSKKKSVVLGFENKQQLFKALKLLTRGKYQIKIAGKIYFTNSNFINKVLDTIRTGKFFDTQEEAIGSDEQFSYLLQTATEIEIMKLDESKNKIKGAFFPYKHKLDGVDLSPIQIYQDITKDFNELNINCLVHSIIQHGLDNNLKSDEWNKIVSDIKFSVMTAEVSQVKIKQIAEQHNLYITIKRPESHRNLRKYGNKEKSKYEIKLGLIEEHYFLIRDVDITEYAIKHYEEIKHKERWNEFIKKDERDKKRFIDSYKLIQAILENKLVEKFTREELQDTGFLNQVKELQEPYYVVNDYPEYKDKKQSPYYVEHHELCFDFETSTEGDKHIPYLCVCDDKTFYGVDCGKQMLEYIIKKYNNIPIRLIAHNAGYDLRFITEYLTELNIIERGHMLLRAEGKYKKLKIQVQDSYALISSKLSGFSKMFGMEQEKEIMPYGLYTKERVEKQFINIKECIIACKLQYQQNNIGVELDVKKEKEFCDLFISNCKKWNCLDGCEVDIIEYSKRYCLIDVAVLKEGWNIFKSWIKEVCDLDTGDYVSLPSLANDYMIKEGVYEGVCYVGGEQREFIQQALVGGRTMCRQNKKWKTNRKIDDFDAVSLYPSAMKRLVGYLMGNPKPLEIKTYDFLKNQDGYFVEILIQKVNKHYAFPLMSKITDGGIRNFTNEMEGETMFVDKITLEDLKEYHEIEFEVVRGYYYNEGRNNKIGSVIQNLFDTRLKAKKAGNPIQNVYKLLMNSAYGKTIMKPIEDETKFIKKDEYENYVSNNFTFMKEAKEITGNFYKVKLDKQINTHKNLASCGIEVLSMSKRIMNEVMCLAEDNDLSIYYQDTDSMHIHTEEVKTLSDLFREKYNRELIGKNMGQFHTDFDSQILKGSMSAVESIFLGKKCYIDKLKGDDEGVYDYHIRMKGVSGDAIKDYAFENKKDLMEVYNDLYEGKELVFDLCCGGKKLSFDFKYNMEIVSKNLFERKIGF